MRVEDRDCTNTTLTQKILDLANQRCYQAFYDSDTYQKAPKLPSKTLPAYILTLAQYYSAKDIGLSLAVIILITLLGLIKSWHIRWFWLLYRYST